MGKSKHVGNKHLYIGTSKDPKRMDTISENLDPYIWKKDDEKLHQRLKESRKEINKGDSYNLQSFSYTIFAEGRRSKYGR